MKLRDTLIVSGAIVVAGCIIAFAMSAGHSPQAEPVTSVKPTAETETKPLDELPVRPKQSLVEVGKRLLGQQSIVGKWEYIFEDRSGKQTLEFFPDGTYYFSAPVNSTKGTYALLDGGRLKTEHPGLVYGTAIDTYYYSMDNQKLKITNDQLGGALSLANEWTSAK
jgi:hypothetical protein